VRKITNKTLKHKKHYLADHYLDAEVDLFSHKMSSEYETDTSLMTFTTLFSTQHFPHIFFLKPTLSAGLPC